MKTLIIVAFLIALGLSQTLSGINDPLCKKYLEKFGTLKSPDGTGATKLAFTGDIAFVSGTSNVKVNLKYSDMDLFNDDTNFSPVQEDGKTTTTPCFDLKLWKFTSNAYSDPVQVTDLPITPDNNFQKQWKYYSFTIPGAELPTRLVETKNTNQFIYKGYYAVAYYAAGTDEVYYTSYFEFSVTVDRATGATIDTSFLPLSYTAGCLHPGQACVIKPDSFIKWCTDLTCTSFATPDLHKNDEFFLQQVVEYPGSDYYLTETEVWYTGNGLNRKATPISVINTTKGQSIIQLKAEFVWNQVTFKVTSHLSDTQAGGRRLLAQTTDVSDAGKIVSFICIKAEGKDTCPTCEEECQAQGFAEDGCPSCSDFDKDTTVNGYILAGFITILIFI